MLKIEAMVGEIVQLEFTLPLGHVSLLAVVRQRNAFRYGFEYLDARSVPELIRRSCEGLAPCE